MKSFRPILILTLLTIPFLIPGTAYSSLPPQLPTLRNPFGGSVRVASLTYFAVFRVPAMNLIHGLMALLMSSHAGDFDKETRRSAYLGIFNSLFLAVAFKSVFEALELTRSAPYRTGTLLSIGVGLASAAIFSRRVPFPWTELRLTSPDKAALAVFAASYLILAGVSFAISRPL